MSRVAQRKSVVSVGSRDFTVSSGHRDFIKSTAKREFLSSVGKREFGVAIVGWRIWGQTDIQPFMTGGVDSTKTFGELP